MPQDIKTLKIRKNGTVKLAREYDHTTLPSMTPGMVVQINATTDVIERATGITSGVIKGLLVEECTINEDQRKLSLLADQAEVAVEQASLASGVEFTVGGIVYHGADSKLTPTSGTGNRVGVSQSAIFSNSGSDLVMLTDEANENVS